MRNALSKKRSLILVAAALVACERAPPPVATRSAATGANVEQQIAASSTSKFIRPGCPATGRWAVCSVEKRLRQTGFVAKRISGESPKRAGFSVPPALYTLGRDSRLELFIYPTEAALARDLAKLDTIQVAPKGAAGAWPTPPVFVRSGNLIAVLLSQDARESERLNLALTAGAPQPSPQ